MNINSPHPTILIVDDVPENLDFLGCLLKENYTIRRAVSGKQTLELAGMSPKPDLILLDVMMPEMDGYECLRRLRENPATRDIPVVFVTARDSTEDEHIGLNLGAIDYITKPLRPAVVQARVHNHVEMKLARDFLLDQTMSLESELRKLVQILSHHFQEPVRQQIIFTQMLERSLPKPINEMAELSLSQIMDGASRLRAMLHGVLLYLTACQAPPPTKPILADLAFDAAYRDVWEAVLSTNAEIIRVTLPAVLINEEQLRIVFRELLRNALEFRGTARIPRIQIEASLKDSEAEFSITDTGIGIPSQFHDRVFWIFERLDSEAGRPGIGIGLALVRKIIEGANGRVWIERSDENGSKFCFSLPRLGGEVSA